jgi:polar amino acid transport system substrate-binding protein
MALHNAQYREQADQTLQVKMLITQRMDVAVKDKNIFIYYLRQPYPTGKLNKEEVQQKLICHKVFRPTAYRFAFLHDDICDDFNFGMVHI